jgi:hypothetical protein
MRQYNQAMIAGEAKKKIKMGVNSKAEKAREGKRPRVMDWEEGDNL